MLKEVPKEELNEDEKTAYYTLEDEDAGWEIHREGGKFVVTGKEMETIMRRVNFSDYESLAYFHNTLRKMGVDAQLRKMGIKDGDIVKIFDWEFQFEE